MIRKVLDTETCPTSNELKAYAANKLLGKRNETVFMHLKYCVNCLRKTAKLKEVPSPDTIIHGPRSFSFKRLLKSLWPFKRS